MAKKSGTAIRDFFISLGFDASEVEKGFKKLERDFAKLNQQTLKVGIANQKIQQETLKTKQQEIKLQTEGARLAVAQERASQARARTAKVVEASEKRSLDYVSRQEAASARVSRITRRADWMMQRQGGKARGLSGTEEYQNYSDQLNAVRQMKSSAKTVSDFRRLNSAIADLNLSYNQLIVKNRELQRRFTTTGFAAKGLKDSFRNLGRSYLSVFAVIGAGGMAAKMGQDLIALRATLLGVSGDAAQAAQDFEFVKNASKTLGISLTEATRSYGKIGAAAKSAGLNIEQGKEIFMATAELATAFSLSDADFEGVSRAMGQILAKGKLSTEELLQLGERIPIVFDSAAKALGTTTRELYKLIETGQVQSVDFAPKVVKEWREYVRTTGMLQQQMQSSRVAMQRFGTTFQENVLKAFDSGAESGLSSFFNNLTEFVENTAPAFRLLGKTLGGALAVIGVSIRAIYQVFRPLTIAVEKLFTYFDRGTDKANKNLSLMQQFVGTLIDSFKFLAATILLPFALLELGVDKFEKSAASIIETQKNVLATLLDPYGVFRDMAGYVQQKLGIGQQSNQTKNEVNIQIQGASVDDDSWIDKMKSAMSDVLQGEYTLNVAGGS